MADTLRIKRRAAGGAAGAPASLANGELAYNEQDSTLYYGLPASVVAIGGPGAFAPIARGLPSGGASGQVLTKNSATNYDVTWSTPSGGGGIAEPSSDGFYGRNVASGLGSWVLAVKKAGDTMTGPLNMGGSAAPYIAWAPTSGATKQFQIVQQGDGVSFNAAGVLVCGTLNLATGAWTFAGGGVFNASLSINYANPALYLQKTATAQGNYIIGTNAGAPRWQMQLGDATAEGVGTAGSDFSLMRCDNAGAFVDYPLKVTRADGRTTFSASPSAPTPVTTTNDTTLATTAFVKAVLAALWSTGDAKLTLKTVADADWVMMNDGTIGSASSGSSTRANADCQALFTLLFNNISDANAPILTSAGGATTRAAQGTAAAAWAANCRMTLTRQLGRHLIIGGSGAGLTARTLGSFFGAETHTQTLAELFAHGHNVSDPTHVHAISGATYLMVGNGGTAPFDMAAASNMYVTNNVGGIQYAATGIGIAGAGSSSPMDINNPSAVWNIMLKL